MNVFCFNGPLINGGPSSNARLSRNKSSQSMAQYIQDIVITK